MKVFLISLMMLASISANAEVVATSDNNLGGKIILTDAKVDCPANMHFYSTTDYAGKYVDAGCWSGDGITGNLHWFSKVYRNTGEWLAVGFIQQTTHRPSDAQ